MTKITQADRDAAAPFIGYQTYEHRLVRAFARHREATIADIHAKIVAWLQDEGFGK